MESPPAKQGKAAADKPLNEKVRNLPLLCVESICKFTPTCELMRLHSTAIPLPGAFWGFGVEASLKKRSPLRLSVDPANHQAADDPNEIFILDGAGTKFAGVKQPAAFRFSPLCEFIEGTTLTTQIFTMGSNYSSDEFHILQGQALLPHLPNLSELTLVVRDVVLSCGTKFTEYNDLLNPGTRNCLPNLRSFAVSIAYRLMNRWSALHLELARFLRVLPIQEMSSLRRLDLPVVVWGGVMAKAVNDVATRNVLAGLCTLHCWQGKSPLEHAWTGCELTPILGQLPNFVSTHCTQLSTLSLMVDGNFEPYLTAFRALSSLATLDLYLVQAILKRPMWKTERACYIDVAGLLGPLHNDSSTLFAIASLFPNAKALALQHNEHSVSPLSFASEYRVWSVLPNVEKLSCFQFDDEYGICSTESVTQFLTSPDLPEAVDLSQISFRSLATDYAALAAVFRAMQANSTRLLLLRGPVHGGALSLLQRLFDANGEDVQLTSRKNRYLGDRFAVSELMEISVVGTKTSGRLQGTQFTIRIASQVSKRSRIFD